MGISYFGASVPSRPQSNLMKAILILWNAAAFTFSYYTFYLSTQSPTNPTQQQDPIPKGSFLGKNSLAPLVNYVRLSSLLVYFCFSYFLNLYMGFVARPIIKLIKHELLPLVEPEVEYYIGTRIALVQAIIISLISIVFQLLLYSQFNAILWDRWLENFFNLYSLTSSVTIIAYINFSLGHVIRATGELGNLSMYIQRLMHLAPIVSRTTYLLGNVVASGKGKHCCMICEIEQ